MGVAVNGTAVVGAVNGKATGRRAAWTNRIVETREVSADELRANPKNWRMHPVQQQMAIRGLLSEVGIVAPLMAYHSERAGGALTLIDGHLRLELGGSWPATILDVSDEEADLILLAYDPITSMAEADKGLLEGLLETVETDNEALRELMELVAKDAGIAVESGEMLDADAQIDRADELRVEWGVEPGQIWQLGDHRLICGDACDPEVVARLLEGATPALMVTDPPYGVEYNPNWRNEAAAAGHLAYSARRVGKVDNDDRIDWSEAYKLFPGDVAYTWSPGGDHIIQTGQALIDSGFEIRNQIIWSKPHFPISRGHYTYQHEPCWYSVKKGSTAHWIGDGKASTVWDIALDKNVEGGHSTQKPLECMARPIRNHEGDVYDPFLGSGTTLMAAENLQRRCFAIDIKPGYVAVALQRYRDATQKLPVLLTGNTE
jgi:DNA modification methylase